MSDDRPRASRPGSARPAAAGAEARLAAAVLLAVRGAGADRRARRHRVPVGVHALDEPARMEGRRADDLRRPRQLSAAAERRALRRGGRGTRSSTRSCRCCCRWCSARSRPSSSTPSFPLRGFLRGLFIMPMMATPVAIALVWTMMFHPQLGVLNYLLSLVGIAAAALGVPPRDRDPVAGAGRDLAMDAARHADRARRPRRDPDRAL